MFLLYIRLVFLFMFSQPVIRYLRVVPLAPLYVGYLPNRPLRYNVKTTLFLLFGLEIVVTYPTTIQLERSLIYILRSYFDKWVVYGGLSLYY